MLTKQKLKDNAKTLAADCACGKCSLGSALLKLQSQIEQTAKNVTKAKTGKLKPGSWLGAYLLIRNETNKTFWAQYRALA